MISGYIDMQIHSSQMVWLYSIARFSFAWAGIVQLTLALSIQDRSLRLSFLRGCAAAVYIEGDPSFSRESFYRK